MKKTSAFQEVLTLPKSAAILSHILLAYCEMLVKCVYYAFDPLLNLSLFSVLTLLGILNCHIEYKHVDSVRYLIERGCPIDNRNNHEETPLLLAMKHDLYDVIPTLLENGADVNAVNRCGQ